MFLRIFLKSFQKIFLNLKKNCIILLRFVFKICQNMSFQSYPSPFTSLLPLKNNVTNIFTLLLKVQMLMK
jgi:hypothetical protein